MAGSWFYQRAGRTVALQVVLFLTGLLWWSVLGIREIEVNLSPEYDALYYGGFALVTAALAALLRGPMAWPRLSWPLVAASVTMPSMAPS